MNSEIRNQKQPMIRKALAVAALLVILGAASSAPTLFAQSFHATHQAGSAFATNADLSAAAATATATSSPFIDSGYFKQAELYLIWSGITGSPSGCTIQVKASADGTTFINSGAAISVTPGTNAVSVFTGAIGEQVEYTYSCTTYPTAGTITLESVYK